MNGKIMHVFDTVLVNVVNPILSNPRVMLLVILLATGTTTYTILDLWFDRTAEVVTQVVTEPTIEPVSEPTPKTSATTPLVVQGASKNHGHNEYSKVGHGHEDIERIRAEIDELTKNFNAHVKLYKEKMRLYHRE